MFSWHTFADEYKRIVDGYMQYNQLESRKFFKILQNSISIALFFDCNREKYEHTSLINLFSFPIFQFTVIITKSTIFCQFFPINYPPFEPSFPFESLFLLLFTPGEEILRSKKTWRGLRFEERIIHDSRVRTQLEKAYTIVIKKDASGEAKTLSLRHSRTENLPGPPPFGS